MTYPVRFAIEMVKIGVSKGHDFTLSDPMDPTAIHLVCLNPGCTTHWTKNLPIVDGDHDFLQLFRDIEQRCPK